MAEGLTPVKYQDMPKSHKRTLYLNGSCQNYRDVINWLRAMCCAEGHVFGGIPSLNVLSNGYPLVQIKVVVTEDGKRISSKFIICKKDLYLIAFHSASRPAYEGACQANSKKPKPAAAGTKYWFQFNHGYEIDICTMFVSDDGSYTSAPWEDMEFRYMTRALIALNHAKKPQSVIVKECQRFFLFLSEAARFRPVEFIVCSILGESWRFELDVWDWEVRSVTMCARAVENDIHSRIKGAAAMFTQPSNLRSQYIDKLRRSYTRLSQIWYAYCLTKEHEVLEAEMRQDSSLFSKLYVKCGKNLRFTLGVLCRMDKPSLLMKFSNDDKGIKKKLEDLEKKGVV